MDRFRRTHAIWNWLPAFRAVAESLRLDEAAKRVGVSASALSRSVSLLEEQLGEALFVRVGRHLQLTGAGQELLIAARDAMRIVDDGIERTREAPQALNLTLGVSPELAPIALSALSAMRARAPHQVVRIHSTRGAPPVQPLLRGELDVALHDSSGQRVGHHASLRATYLGSLPRHLFCGASHPLASTGAFVNAVTLSTFDFAVTLSDRGVPVDDGWPPEVERPRQVQCDDSSVALGCGLSAQCVVALPDHLAAPWVASGQLVQINAAALRPVLLYALRRKPLSSSTFVEFVCDELAGATASYPGFVPPHPAAPPP
jgi:DNA-binding transcriptional LysR family regulator